MFACPHCQCHLERLDSSRGAQWRCPQCEGRAVTVPVLRRMMEAGYVNQLWRAARDAPRTRVGLPCPLCANSMTVVQNLSAGEDFVVHVDVCRACHAVWFDTHEMEHVLERAELPLENREGPEFSEKAKEIIALAEIERIRERADQEDAIQGPPPADGWQALLTVFGIPVEENVPVPVRLPWVTWGVLFLMSVATAWAEWLDPTAIEQWGLKPSDPFRHGGLTFVAGFFLHAGLLHLFGNAAFLAVFGDNVEDFLGHLRYALLLVGSSLAGDLLHMALEPRGTLPVVGASAGISGVIVFYACQFPKARLVYLLRIGVIFRWVRFTAVTGLICWIALQAVGAWQQIAGLTNVSSLAHLGGAVFGLGWWFVARTQENAEIRGPADVRQ